jgi:hypothetical protein
VPTEHEPTDVLRGYINQLAEYFLKPDATADARQAMHREILEIFVAFNTQLLGIGEEFWYTFAVKHGLNPIEGASEAVLATLASMEGHDVNIDQELGYIATLVRDIWAHVLKDVQDRCVFETEDGSPALMCQKDVCPQLGDLVCTVRGSYGEFLMRPCAAEDVGENARSSYRIVGQCVRKSPAWRGSMDSVPPTKRMNLSYVDRLFTYVWDKANVDFCRILIV